IGWLVGIGRRVLGRVAVCWVDGGGWHRSVPSCLDVWAPIGLACPQAPGMPDIAVANPSLLRARAPMHVHMRYHTGKTCRRKDLLHVHWAVPSLAIRSATGAGFTWSTSLSTPYRPAVVTISEEETR